MIEGFFMPVVYQPLYNGLIFLIDVLPWADLGVAIIFFTILVKLVLFPLSQKAVKTQLKMKELDGEMKEIRRKYKDDQEKQARAMIELYRANHLNPFSSILLILIQIPIIISLFFIVKNGVPVVDAQLLYSFVKVPEIDVTFLNVIDVTGKSIILALAAGISQFFQLRYAMPKIAPRDKNTPPSLKEDFARNMQFQMRYGMPIFITIIAYTISGAVALYWATSNIFMIGQEVYQRRKRSGQTPAPFPAGNRAAK